MSVNIRHVAKAAGVSQATAARALNGYGSVSAKSAAKVVAAAEQLGYKTNLIAQALRVGQTRTVGFVPGDLENPFFASVARHLGDTMEAAGYTLLVASSDERGERERKIIETMRAQLVSGLVIAPTAQGDTEHLRALVDDNFPLVLLDRRIRDLPSDSVTVNNEGSGFEAVSHLIRNGHQRIALLTDDTRIASSAERLAGYRRALEHYNIEYDSTLVAVAGSSRNDAYIAAQSLLALTHRPTSIFSSDSLMTEGALRAIRDVQLSVPDDISVIGFDDSELARFFHPPITVISQPVAQLGIQAGNLLLHRLRGETNAPRNVDLHTQMIMRSSVSWLSGYGGDMHPDSARVSP